MQAGAPGLLRSPVTDSVGRERGRRREVREVEKTTNKNSTTPRSPGQTQRGKGGREGEEAKGRTNTKAPSPKLPLTTNIVAHPPGTKLYMHFSFGAPKGGCFDQGLFPYDFVSWFSWFVEILEFFVPKRVLFSNFISWFR